MKKVIGIILAVVLVAGGLGGFVYANNNSQEPMTGQKLIGFGRLGEKETPHGLSVHESWFHFTNPDCVAEITIERIAIISANGTAIYEGPLLKPNIDEETGEVTGTPDDWPPAASPIEPHQFRIIMLFHFMKDPDAADPDRWLTHKEARELDLALYTLEVFWTSSDKKGLPLIGWATELHQRYRWVGDGGRDIRGRSMLKRLAAPRW